MAGEEHDGDDPRDPDHEGLDDFLQEAFHTPKGESVLAAISRLHGETESVVLRPVGDDAVPIRLQRGEDVGGDSRYYVFGEIARGGIGVIYHGRDKNLNRDVALKVLRKEYAEREDVLQRFVEEAQVGGQLQHPGIVPVYGLGLQADGRPSFAMKLIKGQTLAQLLRANPRGIDLIAVFEQIAQTVAYAHSRGVIHRDLKPANVMIGTFGEVYVVDWGFAKVLGQEEVQRAPERTVIATLRSGPVGSQSIAGSVMGTPAYMPPEQALGHIEALDETSDVFALGAVLCEILTGAAPYTGKPRDQLVAAAQCRLTACFERLDAAQAGAELKQLVRDCLAQDGEDRPPHAGAVVDRLTTTLAEAEERARAAQLAVVRARAEAARARSARVRTRVLAGMTALLLTIGGGAYVWSQADADKREREAQPQIESALRLAAEREGAGAFAEAAAAAQKAVDVARSAGLDAAQAETLHARLAAERERAERAARIAAEDDALLAAFDQVRSAWGLGRAASASGGEQDAEDAPTSERLRLHLASEAGYSRALSARYEDLEEAGPRMKASPHAPAFAAHVGAWSRSRKYLVEDGTSEDLDWRRLDALAREIDPGHDDVRTALLEDDMDALLAVAQAHADTLPAPLAGEVGKRLSARNRARDATDFLAAQVERHPQDYRLHELLYASSTNAGERGLALRHALAAVTIRPTSSAAWAAVAGAYRRLGDDLSARRATHRALDLGPDTARAWGSLGLASWAGGDLEEAEACCRRALDLDPTDGRYGATLADVLRLAGKLPEALEVAEQAVANAGAGIQPHHALAAVQEALGDYEAALATFRRALEVRPKDGLMHLGLAMMLDHLRRTEEADRAVARALEVDPRNDRVALLISTRYGRAGRIDEAEALAREVIARSPRNAAARATLAKLLVARAQTDEALAAARTAVSLERSSDNLLLLSLLLRDEGAPAESLQVARQAVARAAPKKLPQCLLHLATLHRARRQYDQALAVIDRCVGVAPEDLEARIVRVGLLRSLDRTEEARASFDELVRTTPVSVGSCLQFGRMQEIFGRKGAAEALRWVERALGLDSESARAHTALADLHLRAGRVPEAKAAAERALDLDPNQAGAHAGLGLVAIREKQPEEALRHFRRAAALTPGHGVNQYYLGTALAATGDLPAAREAFERALRLGARSPATHGSLAQVLGRQGRSVEETEQWLLAFDMTTPETRNINMTAVAARLVMGLVQQDRITEARRVLARAQAARPDDFRLQLVAGLVHDRSGDRRAAERSARAMVARFPSNGGAWQSLGALLWKQGIRPEEARAALLKSIETPTAPGSTLISRSYLANLQAQEGDFAGAEATLRAALEEARTVESPVPVEAALKRLQKRIQKQLDGLPETRRRLEEAGAFLRGEFEPPSARAASEVARTAVYMLRDAEGALRAFRLALEMEPLFSEDPGYSLLRYAAEAAVLAGPAHHAEALRHLRGQARMLALEGFGGPEDRARGIRDLLTSPHLADVRDGADLSPEWKALWAELAALLTKVEKEATR